MDQPRVAERDADGARLARARPCRPGASQGGLVFAVLVLAWTGLRGGRVAARVVVVVLLGFGTLHMWATIRPQLWTFLAFAILCRILSADRPAWRWCLPPLFAFWVNCHGGWVVGFGVHRRMDGGHRAPEPPRLPEVGGCGDDHGVRDVVQSVRMGTLAVPGSDGPYESIDRGVGLLVGHAGDQLDPLVRRLGCGAVAGPAVRRQAPSHRRSARDARLRVRSCHADRIALRPVIRNPPRAVHCRPVARGRETQAVDSVASGTAARRRCARRVDRRKRLDCGRALECIPIAEAWAPDIDGASPLEHATPGRLVTYFDWGGHAIWHFGPRLRVSIDGRRETIYSDERLAESDAVLAGTPAGLAALDKWRAEYVWLPVKSQRTKSWLAAHGYRIDVETAQSFLAVRNDLPVLLSSPARRRPAGTTPCFP